MDNTTDNASTYCQAHTMSEGLYPLHVSFSAFPVTVRVGLSIPIFMWRHHTLGRLGGLPKGHTTR